MPGSSVLLLEMFDGHLFYKSVIVPVLTGIHISSLFYYLKLTKSNIEIEISVENLQFCWDKRRLKLQRYLSSNPVE